MGGRGGARFPATVSSLPLRRRGRAGGRIWAAKVGVRERGGGALALAPEDRGAARRQGAPSPCVWVARGDPAPAPSRRRADWLLPALLRLPWPRPARPCSASPRYCGVVGAATRGLGDGQVSGPAPPARASSCLPRGAYADRRDGHPAPTRRRPLLPHVARRRWRSLCQLQLFLAGGVNGCVLCPEPFGFGGCWCYTLI
ncbi:putative hydro-lyase KRH_21160 [Macaca nemestrina]|uniref:putative hydro-lyase KRH_21160 n=1 Tax=Macaca nemestrina TaxID=9545 RepID=UPI0039B93A77